MPGHIRKRGRRKDGSTRWQARYTDPTQHPASTRKIERTFPTRERYIALASGVDPSSAQDREAASRIGID